jgi:hypothetical protein
MKITDEDIIQSAKRQRQSVENKMKTPSNFSMGRTKSLPLWGGLLGGIAASLIGFFAGFSLHANMPEPPTQPVAQTVQIQHDTIMQVQTVRDTVYQTRVVTKYEEPMLAEADDDTPAEQNACSMLCDEIPYELLASGR